MDKLIDIGASFLGEAFAGLLSAIPIENTFVGSIISNYGSALIKNSFTPKSLSELAYNNIKKK